MFNALSVKDTVSWTALLMGYAQHGYLEQALRDIELMQAGGMNPDAVTFVSCIKSCTNLGDIVRGLELHAQVTRKGLEGDLLIGSMLVDMYAKCGLLFEAEDLFQKLPVRGVIAWNVLVAAYIEHELDEKAISCFDKMQLEGIPPNAAMYVSILKACGYLGALSKGQDLHNDIKATGPLETDLIIRHSLVDMYAKSGSIAKAQELFDDLPVQELASWNALLAGYAQHGADARILHALHEMNLQGVRPNLVTFVNLLNACNHAGLLYKGQMYFKAMSIEYHIIPALEHYTCMVNLFCRAGQLHEAVGMIERMPLYPDFVIWRTFLGACQKWGNVELGRDAFDRLIESDEVDSVSFIYMSNICADAETL
jgi:pentatricopeptide repeat protein